MGNSLIGRILILRPFRDRSRKGDDMYHSHTEQVLSHDFTAILVSQNNKMAAMSVVRCVIRKVEVAYRRIALAVATAGPSLFFSGSGSFDSLFEGLDSRLRVCTRSRMPKIAIEITGWRKNSGRDYGKIQPYCGPSIWTLYFA